MPLIRSQLIRVFIIAVLSFSVKAVATEAVQITVENIRLNADMVIAQGSELADGVFLIVHGTLAHKDMEIIDALQSSLQELGHNSLAISLSLGIDDRHGFYPCEHPHSHRSEDAVDELRVWVSWLASQGATDITLLGHSRGANQATRYALSDGAAISALVLLAPPATDAVPSDEAVEDISSRSDNDWLSTQRFLHCNDSDVQIGSYLSYYGAESQSNTLTLLDGIDVPTLVISGSDDDVVVGLASRMQQVENKSVSHVEIDGAGHFFRDLYLYDVVDAIESFREPAD